MCIFRGPQPHLLTDRSVLCRSTRKSSPSRRQTTLGKNGASRGSASFLGRLGVMLNLRCSIALSVALLMAGGRLTTCGAMRTNLCWVTRSIADSTSVACGTSLERSGIYAYSPTPCSHHSSEKTPSNCVYYTPRLQIPVALPMSAHRSKTSTRKEDVAPVTVRGTLVRGSAPVERPHAQPTCELRPACALANGVSHHCIAKSSVPAPTPAANPGDNAQETLQNVQVSIQCLNSGCKDGLTACTHL